MRCTALLLLALVPLAAARRPLAEAPAPVPLDGSEPEGWYLNQTDTFERRSIVLNLPGGKTFTLVLPRLLKDSKVGRRRRRRRRCRMRGQQGYPRDVPTLQNPNMAASMCLLTPWDYPQLAAGLPQELQ